MKERKWRTEAKLAIVLIEVKEKRSVADICREQKIGQALYYRWKDKFFEAGKSGLANISSGDKYYKAEVERLKNIIGKEAIQIEIKTEELLGVKG